MMLRWKINFHSFRMKNRLVKENVRKSIKFEKMKKIGKRYKSLKIDWNQENDVRSVIIKNE